jgi:predicted DCC family thiol-disulfide oxidoreductase YuxK
MMERQPEARSVNSDQRDGESSGLEAAGFRADGTDASPLARKEAAESALPSINQTSESALSDGPSVLPDAKTVLPSLSTKMNNETRHGGSTEKVKEDLERAHRLLQTGKSIIFFDGVCNLCNASVDFLLKRDAQQNFYFASLQSGIARELLAPYGDSLPDSMVLLQGERIYLRSDAALKAAQGLSPAYRLAGKAGMLIPAFLRNAIYDFIAANRLRFFGERDSCRLPSPEERERFLG